MTDPTNDATGKKSDNALRPPLKTQNNKAHPEKDAHIKPQPISREDAERNLPADPDPDDPVSP